MTRAPKPTNKPPSTTSSRSHALVDVTTVGDAALVTVAGLVDEHFPGFGDVGPARAVVLDVTAMTRMTSFGVRQWIKGVESLPKSADLYLLGCPTFFVDQLNMVLNFGGACKALTVVAPFTCPSCGVEAGETIDVYGERAALSQGSLAPRTCSRCGARLELDETLESYFAFATKYAATGLHPAAAQLLAARGLYNAIASEDAGPEKPPKIIKLVHGSVTYFRIQGTIGTMFRARPILIGAEGEIVIDLAEIERFDPSGHKEWKRLLKGLATQVPSVSLVDISEQSLAVAGDTLSMARNIVVASLLVSRRCRDCGRTSNESASLERAVYPFHFGPGVCGMCGGTTEALITTAALAPLQKASTSPPPASAKVIAAREEILSRALTDANVAQAGDSATAAITADDTILGKYKMIQRLSVGGMAEVFLANQIGIGGFEKLVALKRIQRKLLDSRHLAIDMFLNEAKIAGRLTHPNIVQVLDVGEVGGALYLAMEYVHGKDLRAVTKKLKQNDAQLPLGEAIFVVREVAQALHHAYWANDMNGKRLSVVHRDVSPHNIILGYDGAVKLIDFGVAMSAITDHAESIVVGKWHYMSPEATTNGQVDHRSDLFSLGVVLYLLSSGAMPFTDREPKDIVKKIRSGSYAPLQEIAMVPDALASLVHRMLAPNPNDRPQKGAEVVATLNDIARKSGIESTGAQIAELLANLFPDEATSGFEEAPLDIREVRHDDSGAKSPTTFTPPTMSKWDGAVDVSVTLQRRPSKTRVTAQPYPAQQPKLPTLKSSGPSIGLILIVIAIAAVIAVIAYFGLPNY